MSGVELAVGEHLFVLSDQEGVPLCRVHDSWDCALFLDDDEAAELEEGSTSG